MLMRIARRVKRMTASQAFSSSVPFSLAPTMRVPALPGAPACWYWTKLRLWYTLDQALGCTSDAVTDWSVSNSYICHVIGGAVPPLRPPSLMSSGRGRGLAC